MLSYLQSIFGPNITVTEYHLEKSVPLYYDLRYSIKLLSWGQVYSIMPKRSFMEASNTKKTVKEFSRTYSNPLCIGT